MSDELSVRCVASAQDEDPAKDAAYWQLTPKNQCDTVTIFVDRRKIIPVLFLPGIMGTNLKIKNLVEILCGHHQTIFFQGLSLCWNI